MISKTKYLLKDQKIKELFNAAQIINVSSIKLLGEGEYNAVYEVVADKNYVLKIAPEESMPILTYEKNMMQAEVYWYEIMQEKTSIRTPKIYYKDFSKTPIPTDWFIMEKLDGEQRNNFKMTKQEQESVLKSTVQMASQLHRVHNDKFGYIQNSLEDNWYDALKAIAENLKNDKYKLGKKSKNASLYLKYVEKYKDLLITVPCCMINYDIWDPNILCKRDKKGDIELAWIDPERSLWGDNIFDFVCFETMAPMKDKKISLDAYNEVAETPIIVNKDIEIRYAFAQGLLGLILETEKYYRYTPHHFGWWRNVFDYTYLYNQAFKVLKNDNNKRIKR